PAIVLSPVAYNRRVGLALFCPITSQIKGYPFEVRLPSEFPINGVILADQIKSLDWRVRNAEIVARLPDDVVAEALDRLGTLISA
ncbi:MAG: type II toxin-antitoxin system PemK/MazF family toxin, partial [Candidatus Dormibacteraceae bacterium]